MNPYMQRMMQTITDPCDLADSVSSFVSSRSEKINPTVVAISEVIDGTRTVANFKNDTTIYHKWAVSLSDDLLTGNYINLDELIDALDESIEHIERDPTINVYSQSGSILETISTTEALDRIHSLVSETEMLITALNIAQQSVDEESSSFLVNTFARIEGYLQESNVVSRMKGIFTSIYEELRENVAEPSSLVESILVHFGMVGDNNDPRRNDASEYTGQSARCTLFMDAAEKLGWAISTLPTALSYVAGFIGVLVSAVGKILETAYKGIQRLTYKAIARTFELDDGIQKTSLPGRGYIKHPGFAIVFDGDHTYFPTGEALANVFNDLQTAIGSIASESQQYTIPAGPVVIYLDWKVDKAKLTYDLRPVDHKVYTQVYRDHFGNDPYFSIKVEGGVIKADNSGENLSGKDTMALLEFIEDLYSRDNIWQMDYDFDSDRYMCIQASKHLCSILYAISTGEGVISSLTASDANDAFVFMDVTKEFGYNYTSHAFIPENINFASMCTAMGTRSGRVDCFYGYLNDYNELDYTDSTVLPSITSCDCELMAFMGRIAVAALENDPLSPNTFFVPYFHRFKAYRPSYYIPTNAENVSNLKRMIVTGLTVIAVVAVVVVTAYLGTKLKKHKWMMEQQAAQKAFTASETGNAALLQQGWKLQKRVNLLGVLSGAPVVAATPISNGVSAAITALKTGDSSSQVAEPSLEAIVNLIK